MQAEDTFEVPLLVEVARHPKSKFIGDLSLVLAARDIESQVVHVQSREGPRWAVLVEELDGPRARAELDLYRRENTTWTGRTVPFEPRLGAWMGSAWYVGLLLVCFAFQGQPGGAWELGVANAEAILGGDWALAFSALCLHADLLHLVGNLFFGALFGYLVAAEIGSGAAWLGILLAGGIGNMFNALLYVEGLGQPHFSLGASTAMFGAVGIMSVLGWARRREQAASFWRRSASPVLGLVMLGLYGMSGERTDVSAHAFGLLAGGMIGFGLLPLRKYLDGPKGDRLGAGMGLLAGALLGVVSWSVWA